MVLLVYARTARQATQNRIFVAALLFDGEDMTFRSSDSVAESVKPLDCLGIGFGPANIALAVAMSEQRFLGTCHFLESAGDSGWQTGQLLEGCDIQHHPLRDFVTPRNPRSPFGFLSYLHEVGRLFEFLNLEQAFPPRSEYDGYIRWVAGKFASLVSYGATVNRLSLTEDARLFRVTTRDGRIWRARSVVFATGRSPIIPQAFVGVGERAVHASGYLQSLRDLPQGGRAPSFAIVGASQAAVEIALDLHSRFRDTTIHLICRSQGIKLKDTSPFTERIYFPEFVDYYHDVPEEAQHRISKELWRSNYGAADHDIVTALALRFYEEKVAGQARLHLHSYTEINTAELAGGQVRLALKDVNTGAPSSLGIDRVILATGYKNFGGGAEREPYHPLLGELAPLVARRDDGSLEIARDYRLVAANVDQPIPPLYVNGLCESTHGFGDAGSFSLLSIRSMTILDSLCAALRIGSALAA
jgi:L-ornithine N5-monooxygenase